MEQPEGPQPGGMPWELSVCRSFKLRSLNRLKRRDTRGALVQSLGYVYAHGANNRDPRQVTHCLACFLLHQLAHGEEPWELWRGALPSGGPSESQPQGKGVPQRVRGTLPAQAGDGALSWRVSDRAVWVRDRKGWWPASAGEVLAEPKNRRGAPHCRAYLTPRAAGPSTAVRKAQPREPTTT